MTTNRSAISKLQQGQNFPNKIDTVNAETAKSEDPGPQAERGKTTLREIEGEIRCARVGDAV